MNLNELPLAGIRVIEFTHMVMGPSIGLVLADLGADVVKIEPPTGDAYRRFGHTVGGLGTCFSHVNRGKRLVVLVGQRKAVAIAVKNGGARRRWSKLKEWLSAGAVGHAPRRT